MPLAGPLGALMPLADPVVDWGALLKVLWTALLAGVGVTAVFAFAILGAARTVELRRDGHAVAAGAYAALTTVALLAVAASLVIGIVVMAHK
jgi:hypothetical protein